MIDNTTLGTLVAAGLFVLTSVLLVGPDEQHLPQMSMSNAAVVNTAAFCGAKQDDSEQIG